MIIQGSNNPLVIQFDQDMSGYDTLVITVWKGISAGTYNILKRWNKADLTVSGDTVTCPLTEAETKTFPASSVNVEAKALNDDGDTIFWAEMDVNVMFRRDRIISLGGGT